MRYKFVPIILALLLSFSFAFAEGIREQPHQETTPVIT